MEENERRPTGPLRVVGGASGEAAKAGTGLASEVSGEASPEERWLSYADLARIRGIGRDSAVKLVQRERWRKQAGNDGSIRVLVPPEWLKPAREPREATSPEDTTASAEDTPAPSGEFGLAISGLREAIAVLREQIGRLGARADRAEQQIEQMAGRAERAEQCARQAEHERDRERERADAAERARQEAEHAAEGLRQADEARRARSRWARLAAAWRGR